MTYQVGARFKALDEGALDRGALLIAHALKLDSIILISVQVCLLPLYLMPFVPSNVAHLFLAIDFLSL